MRFTHPARILVCFFYCAIIAHLCWVSEEKSPFDSSPVLQVRPYGLLWLGINSDVNSWRNGPWRCLHLYTRHGGITTPHGIPEIPKFELVYFWNYVWHFKANDRNDQQILEDSSYLVTPWSRILLEKLTGSQLILVFMISDSPAQPGSDPINFGFFRQMVATEQCFKTDNDLFIPHLLQLGNQIALPFDAV